MRSPHPGHFTGPAAYSWKHAGHVRVSDVTSTTIVADLRAVSSSSER